MRCEVCGAELAAITTDLPFKIRERGATSWGAHVPDLPGCAAVGESREEVLRLIREAIEFHIDGMKQDGLPVPAPRSAGEFVEVGAA